MAEVVYAIGSAGSPLVKIGKAVDLDKRLGEIQRMSPAPLAVLWSAGGGLELEAALHAKFNSRRAYGEWFDFTDEDAVVLIASAAAVALVAAKDAEAILAELNALRQARIVAERQLALISAKSSALVPEALRAGARPSATARASGYTDGYVRKLRNEANLPSDPRYAHVRPPTRRQTKSTPES